MTVRPSNVISTESLNQCCIVIDTPDANVPALNDPIVVHVTRTFPDPEALTDSSVFRFWCSTYEPLGFRVTALMVTPAVRQTV